MGNYFLILKKTVPKVNQRGKVSGTEIYGLMLHFFWLSYFIAKTIDECQKNILSPFQVTEFLKTSNSKLQKRF